MSHIMHPEVFTKAMSRHTAELMAGGNGTLEYLKAYRDTYDDLARGELGVSEYIATLDTAILSWESGRKPDFNDIDMPMGEKPVTLYEKLAQYVTKWRRGINLKDATPHALGVSGAVAGEQAKGTFFMEAKGDPAFYRSFEELMARIKSTHSVIQPGAVSATDPEWLSLAEAEHGVMTPEKVDAVIESDAGANHPLMRTLRGGQGTELERKVAVFHYLVFVPE